MAKPSPTTVGYDEWPLSIALWMKFFNSHGKYRPELNKYFHIFCARSALGISWQHLNQPNLLVRSVYSFYVHFHVRLMLYDLGISLPLEDAFSKVNNSYIKSDFYGICDGYGVNSNKTRMHADWFYTTVYGIFGHEVKVTERSPPDNMTQWIITKSKGFTKKHIEKISRSMRAYAYLFLTSQVQARSSIVSNSAPAVDAHQVLKITFKALINNRRLFY